jgi:hypothetical protein
MTPAQDVSRFRDNLPFAANGTLSHDEQAWMTAFLAQHPAFEHELLQAHHERMHSLGLASNIPEPQRLDHLLRELGWSNRDVLVTKHRASPSWRGLVSARSLANWGYVASGLLGAAAASLWFMGLSSDALAPSQDAPGQSAIYRGASNDCSAVQRIRITLKPSQPWSAVVTMLRSMQLQISSGPTDEGEIWVLTHADTPLPQTLALLRNHPAIEQALPGIVQVPEACKP